MLFTPRFILLVTAFGVIYGFSSRHLVLGPLAIALAAVITILTVRDIIHLSNARHTSLDRIVDEKLSLGADNPVKISILNDSNTRLNLRIRDEYPIGMSSDDAVFNLSVAPLKRVTHTYHVMPHRRGDYDFFDTYARFHGPYGLVVRQKKYTTAKAVKVYPNLIDIRKYELAARNEQYTQQGQRKPRRMGQGLDFESLREYVVDDDYRHIDWKATARKSSLVTRQYQEERSQNIILALDCGRIMGPVVEGLTKLDYAINASMMLAHIANIKGDKVGICAFADDVQRFVPPRQGRDQSRNLLKISYDLQEARGDSDYRKAISYLSQKWRRRSLLVMFTDLSDPESNAPLISAMANISRKHLCVCVALTDTPVLQAAEKPPQNVYDVAEMAAAKQVLTQRQRAIAKLRQSNITVIDATPEQFTPALVNEYMKIKTQGRL